MSWIDDLQNFYGGVQKWATRHALHGSSPNFHNISEDAKQLGLNDAQLRYYAQSVPVLGDIARFYDNNQKTKDYMRNRGLSWDDVLYPTSLPSGSLGSSIASIDKNIDAISRLYQDDEVYSRNLDPDWNEYGRSKYKKW